MKELDVFRYLKKYRSWITGISILAGILFFLIAKYYIQQYTAMTVIEYTGSRAAEGFSPDDQSGSAGDERAWHSLQGRDGR